MNKLNFSMCVAATLLALACNHENDRAMTPANGTMSNPSTDPDPAANTTGRSGMEPTGPNYGNSSTGNGTMDDGTGRGSNGTTGSGSGSTGSGSGSGNGSTGTGSGNGTTGTGNGSTGSGSGNNGNGSTGSGMGNGSPSR